MNYGRYTYRFDPDPDKDPRLNVAASMEMDGIRAQMAPTAGDLRRNVLAALAETNGHAPDRTHRVLGSDHDG
jgi:hypothetical protein